MKVAERIARQRADVIFVVVGGEEIHYGWDKLHTGLAELQAVGAEPGQTTTCPGSSSSAGSCPSNWPTSSG